MLCFLFCFSSCCVPHVASFFELSNFDFPLVLSNVYFITYTGPFTVLDSGTSIKSGWIKARNVDFIAKVKTELRKRKNISQVPKHYEIGPRKLNIVLTWLRCFASFLNYDLFQVNIVSDPSCRCGANHEDSYHFFFDCSHYSNIRHTLFQNFNWLPNYCVLDLTPLYEQNEISFKHVF